MTWSESIEMDSWMSQEEIDKLIEWQKEYNDLLVKAARFIIMNTRDFTVKKRDYVKKWDYELTVKNNKVLRKNSSAKEYEEVDDMTELMMFSSEFNLLEIWEWNIYM